MSLILFRITVLQSHPISTSVTEQINGQIHKYRYTEMMEFMSLKGKTTYVSFAVSSLNICTVSVLLDEARNIESGLKANE